jgi:hypothetical protein
VRILDDPPLDEAAAADGLRSSTTSLHAHLPDAVAASPSKRLVKKTPRLTGSQRGERPTAVWLPPHQAPLAHPDRRRINTRRLVTELIHGSYELVSDARASRRTAPDRVRDQYRDPE